MTLPRLSADKTAPVAFDDRSTFEAMIDMAAAGLRGALMASEAEFDGEMSVTLEILLRATNEFLEDVGREAGADIEAAYRQRLIESLEAK